MAVDIGALDGADYLLVGDATDGSTKRARVSDLTLTAANNLSLQHSVKPGSGLTFSNSGNNSTGFNNSSTQTIDIKLVTNGGLSIDASNQLAITPNSLNSKQTPAELDEIIIADSTAQFGVKKITLASLKTLSNSLTVGNGLDFDAGTSYNNTAARQINLKLLGSTLTASPSGLSVAKVPNTLSAGTGISSLSYDGSSTATVSIDTSEVATFST